MIVRITTRIAHSQGIVELGEKEDVPVKPFVRNPQKYVMLPAHARPRHMFIEEQHQEAEGVFQQESASTASSGETKNAASSPTAWPTST